jgi:hypothetical protein
MEAYGFNKRLQDAMNKQRELQGEKPEILTHEPKKVNYMKLAYLVLTVILLIGEVKCVIKMCSCNWESVGKSEAVYTIGTFTGLGCVIGYIDIKDK